MYEKVLVAIDRSENSKRALAAARELASLSDGEVRILHLREQEVIPRMGLVANESPEEAHLWLAEVTAPRRFAVPSWQVLLRRQLTRSTESGLLEDGLPL